MSGILRIVAPYKIERDGEIVPVNCLNIPTQPRCIEDYPEDRDAMTPHGGLRLKGYQRRASSFIQQALTSYGLDTLGFRANGCLYNAKPGMGKTITSLHALHRAGWLASQGLIIGPMQSRETWCSPKADPATFFDLHIEEISPELLRKGRVESSGWYFVHYEVLDDVKIRIQQGDFPFAPETIIFDESQYLSNPKAERTEAGRLMSHMPSVVRRVLLTATPIRSGRHNLWGQLDIMQPGQWGSAHEFSVRYAGLTQQRTAGGHVYWAKGKPTNTVELRSRMSDFVVKVNRGTAATGEGTKIIRQPIYLQLTNDERSEMQEAILEAGRKAARARAEKGPKKVRAKIGNLKLVTTTGGGSDEDARTYPAKLVALTHTISAMARIKVRHAATAIASGLGDHKYTIVFTERRDAARRIIHELKDLTDIVVLGPLDGAMPEKKRWAICESLVNYDRAVLVATAASIGVSNHALRVATKCIITTPEWNPDTNLQREGRLLSEGDDVKEKIAQYLLIEDSPVDKRILERIAEKEADTSDVFGLGPDEELSGDLLSDSPYATREDMAVSELWDAISNKLLHRIVDTPGSGPSLLEQAEPAPESEPFAEPPVDDTKAAPKGNLYLPYVVGMDGSSNWKEEAPKEALMCLSELPDDCLSALARHPDLGWAVLAQEEGSDEVRCLWSEQIR